MSPNGAIGEHPLDDLAAYAIDALDDVEWRDGDVLVVGSSAAGPAARVFLGSHGSKIVRHAPVPVVVVPRSAVAGLLDS